MSTTAFTSERPTASGWYLVKTEGYGDEKARVVFVDMKKDYGHGMVSYPSGETGNVRGCFLDLAPENLLWCGPKKAPEPIPGARIQFKV